MMNLLKQRSITNKLCAVAVAGLFLNTTCLNAQQVSKVVSLRYNNKPVETANVDVLPPKEQGANSKSLTKGASLRSGTKLVIPANTLVQLKSPGGTQNIRSSNLKSMEYTVVLTAKGENHIVSGDGASIINKVDPRKFVGYDYRNSNGRGTTAASRATEFTFTDLSSGKNEKASISTNEGTVHITEQRKVTIQGVPVKNNSRGEIGKSVSTMQSAGSGEFISSDEPFDYRDYLEAINAISNELDSEDEDDQAEDLMCLGKLYIALEEPAKAIAHFKKAYEYFGSEYGEDATETLEAQLSLAEAYNLAGNLKESSRLVEEALQILKEIIEDIEEDIEFVHDDEEALKLICDDIVEVAELCGWAYDIIGDTEESEEFYEQADKGCT